MRPPFTWTPTDRERPKMRIWPNEPATQHVPREFEPGFFAILYNSRSSRPMPTDAGYLLDLAWAVVCLSWLVAVLWIGGVI